MAGYNGTSTRRVGPEAFAAAVESERRDMNVAARGRIVSYDPATQTATVKPLLRQTIAGQTIEAPDLLEVPVRQARGGGFAVHKPVKGGDEVDLVFYSRSHESYQADGESSDAAPGRMNDLSDAVAFPGGSSAKTKMSGLPADRLHIGTEDGKSGFQQTADGKLDLVKDGDSVLSIVRDFLVAFRDHLQPAAHNKIADANALIARIDQIKA